MKTGKITISILLISIVALRVVVSQSIWQQISPIPPEVNYNDLSFINEQEGWVAGNDGMIIHTTDGGESWEVMAQPFSDYIKGIHFLNSDTGWVAGSKIFKTQDGGNSWQYSFSHFGFTYFNAIYFLNAVTGFAATTYGEIYRTTDGGLHWNLSWEGSSYLNSLYFFDDNLGWAVGSSFIVKTTNGGDNWIKTSFSSTGNYLEDIFFLDPATGWIAGQTDMYLKTTDGGDTWDSIPFLIGGRTLAVRFYDENLGFLYCSNDWYRTTDGGTSWEVINSNGGGNAVTLPLGDFICVVEDERIHCSKDLGNNWQTVEPAIDIDLNAISVTPGTDGHLYIAGADGKLYQSQDLGQTWSELNSGTSVNLNDLCFISANVGWVAGDNGVLLHTTNGGNEWNVNDLGIFYDLNTITFADTELGWLAGDHGILYRTTDAGENWEALSTGSTGSFVDMSFVNADYGWLIGDEIYKTGDGGNTWELQDSITDNDVYGICFTDENHGWLSGYGILLHTSDGGLSWDVQMEGTGSGISQWYDIQFADNLLGWTCGRHGGAFHTTDGGQHWIPQSIYATNIDLHAVEMVDNKHGLMVGEGGAIYYTDQMDYLAPFILDQPDDTTVCEDENLLFEVEAMGDSLQYQWHKGNGIISGANAKQLVLDSVQADDGDIYTCKIINGAGYAITENIVLSVEPKVKITAQPSDITAHVNEIIIFNQAVTGALPIDYQWQKNGIDIPGATIHTHAIYGVQYSDSGYYRCVVSNGCNEEITEEAKLTVLPPSAIGENSVSGFQIVPNPATDKIKIEGMDPGDYDYSIFNMHGELKLKGTLNSPESHEIFIDLFEKGLYIIKFETGKVTYISRFVKY